MEKRILYFRNDDLGWLPIQFEQMLELFRRHSLPLCAAAIPLYCQDTYKAGHFDKDSAVLEIHAHGYSHLDHQSSGKKAEFGTERSPEGVAYDLQRSFAITKNLFANQFYPAFTPPWNRIEKQYYPLLVENGFKVLSRDGAKDSMTNGLIDLNIDIDIHTSKSGKIKDVDTIISAIEKVWTQKNVCGVMLHHKHMDAEDYIVLDKLLAKIKELNWSVGKYNDIFPVEAH